ncbi:MAG: aldo/keto reductase [Woeseiaceae bacterium]|nr:aldo/keto reductase [Woeseiaceae bacterium]
MTDVERVELVPGYSVARVINGCWQLSPDHGGGPDSQEDALRQFSELVDYGFTTFDCADIYHGTEELLGQFRRSLPHPDHIQVHTKYVPDKKYLHELSAADVDAAINRSLHRLGVDCLDLVQFHWWSYDVPGIEAVTERLANAQERGKIRLIGVTNFDTPHVRQLVETGVPVISMQTQYSLIDRRPEKLLADYMAKSGIHLFAYGALAGGFLSDRYLGKESPSNMNRSLQKYRLMIEEAGGWHEYQQLLRILRAIAEKHGSTIATVAARWVLDRAPVAAVILGVGREPRAQQHAGIFELILDAEDCQAIEAQLREQAVPPGDTYELERDPGGKHAKIIKTNLRD